MRILGIDPGLNATGYGVIVAESGRVQLIAAGALKPSARQPLGARLSYLYAELDQLIRAHQPTIAVLEGLYTHHEFLTTAALMGHARGVACLVSAQRGLEVIEYLPTRVKKSLTGNGYASKEQVARVVGMWLGRRDPSWSSDATDGLALAIAHAHISQAPAAALAGRRRSLRELAAIAEASK